MLSLRLAPEVKLIRPLTHTYPDKTPYRRPVEVEAQILELLGLSRDNQMVRLRITDPQDSRFVRPEVLMYFLRETRGENHLGRFNTLYELLMRRFGRFFRSAETHREGQTLVDVSLAEIRELAEHALMEKILQDRKTGDDRLDIYECKFGMTVKKDRLSARRPVDRNTYREEALNAAEGDQEYAPHVEKALHAEAVKLLTSNNDVGHDRQKVLAAISTLPDKYRRVAIMMMHNIPAESVDPYRITVSQALRCTPKTARYRGTEAAKRVRKALGMEDQE